MKFCMSYSCGKDSTLALHNMIRDGNEPVALIVTMNKDKRSWFHGVDSELLARVSESLGIPVIEAVCSGDDYEDAFVTALGKAADAGATHCAFGDIDIIDHLKWGENICSRAGFAPVFPLWQRNREEVTDEFIGLGFKAVIKAVSKAHGLDKAILGQLLTRELVGDIVSQGADACGENGEYHTFVYDGSIFSFPVAFDAAGIFESEYSYSLVIEPVKS